MEPKEIGKRIKAARKKRHWTQLEFAREANVSPSSIARWERGGLPPVRELNRIAAVLGVDSDYLVEEQPTDESELAALRGELGEVLRLVRLVLDLLEKQAEQPSARAARATKRRPA